MPDGQFQPQPTQASETMIKPSRYTVLVPLRRGRHLAYNTLSKAFSVWDSDDMAHWSALTEAREMAFQPRYRGFVQGGYVVAAGADERETLRRSYDAARHNDGHLMMTIAPTLSCNFACHYCFQGLDKPDQKMTPKVREATKAFLRQSLVGRKSFHLTWYGGEPLMDQDTIWDISGDVIAQCDALGIKYSATMISNGYGLTLAVARKLRDARVETVQITIDGDKDAHDARRHLINGRGSFARILRNIRSVARHGLMRITVRMNLDGENESQAVGLLDALEEAGLGVRNGVSVYFAPVESVAEAAGGCTGCFSKTEYAEVETRLTRLAFEKGLMNLPKMPRFLGMCTAVRPSAFVIVPNGDLHKCWDTVMDPGKRVGTLTGKRRRTDAGTEALWNGWSPFENHVCSDCKLLPACAGACAFKFVHNDYASGEAAKLPCPSLKFNMAEQLFQRARSLGHVDDNDWDPDRSPTVGEDGLLTGDRHTFSSVGAIYHWLRDMHPLPG